VIEGLDAAVAVVDPATLELLFCNQRYQQWFTPDQPADSQLGYCDLRLVELMRRATWTWKCGWTRPRAGFPCAGAAYAGWAASCP
jgi:hypothetical protein